MRLSSVLAVLVACAAVVQLPVPAHAAGSRPTCHGVQATLVGQPHGTVRGTAVRDVVVTRGATTVVARGGDDLVCVTGDSTYVQVQGGRGDDRVWVGSPRAHVFFNAGVGDDLYVGNENDDDITAYGGGRDRFDTGAGDDVVELYRPAPGGRATLRLGRGDDLVTIKTQPGRSSLDPDRVDVDLYHRSAHLLNSATGRRARVGLHDVDQVSVVNFLDARVVGDLEANSLLAVDACHVTLSGLAGDDTLAADVSDVPPTCATPATSSADGGDGYDRCLTDEQVACERTD